MTRRHADRRVRLTAAVFGALVAVAGVTAVTGVTGVTVPADARPDARPHVEPHVGPYVPSGQPITGGDDAGGAVPLRPGVHVDTLAQGAATPVDTGSVRFFAIAVRTGQTPYVAATVAAPDEPPDDGFLGVEISLAPRGETSGCESESKSTYATGDRLDPVTAVAAPGAIGSENGCPAGTLVVRVERTGDVVVDEPLDVELAYRLEPAVASTAGLPAPVTSDPPAVKASLTGTPATLASGNSFDAAPLVGTGIYKDALTAGDTRIVRVRLDWGQRFAYSFAASARPGVTSDDSVDATAELRNPLRQVAAQSSGARTSAFSVGETDASMAGSTLAPVRYLNRRSDESDLAGYATAGDYYLVLGTNVPTDGDTTLSYPYSLQIQVFWTPQAPPEYVGQSTTRPPAETSDDRVLIAGVAGGVVLVLVAVFVVVLVRRRRRDRAATRQVRVQR